MPLFPVLHKLLCSYFSLTPRIYSDKWIILKVTKSLTVTSWVLEAQQLRKELKVQLRPQIVTDVVGEPASDPDGVAPPPQCCPPPPPATAEAQPWTPVANEITKKTA